MRELVTWLMAVAAVCAHAVTSPLGTNPENYVFAPFDDSAESSDRGGTNGVKALLQGYVMGPNASYRVIRAEDVAYMAEAVAERAAYLNGWKQPRTYTNSLGQARKSVYSRSNIDLQLVNRSEPRGPSLEVYPGSSFSSMSWWEDLPTGYFASDPFRDGLTFCFYPDGGSFKKARWYFYTNHVETVKTNKYIATRETNTKRDDWPDIQDDKGEEREVSRLKYPPAILASQEKTFWPSNSLVEKICTGVPVNSYLKAYVKALWPEKALEQVNWDDGDAFVPNYNDAQWWMIGHRSSPRPDWQVVRGLYRAFAACKCLVHEVRLNSLTNVITKTEHPATDAQGVRYNADSQQYETYDDSQPAKDPSPVSTNQQVHAEFSGSVRRRLGRYNDQWLESYDSQYSSTTTEGGKALLRFPFSGWMLRPRAKKPAVIDSAAIDVVLIGSFSIEDLTIISYYDVHEEDPPPSGVVTNMFFAYRMPATIEQEGGATTSTSDATNLFLCVEIDTVDLSGIAGRLCEAAGVPFIDNNWDHTEAPSPTQDYGTERHYSWQIHVLGSRPYMITFPKFGTDIPYQEGGTD